MFRRDLEITDYVRNFETFMAVLLPHRTSNAASLHHHQSRDQNRWIEIKILIVLNRLPSDGHSNFFLDGILTNASKCKSNNFSRDQFDWFKIDFNAIMHPSTKVNPRIWNSNFDFYFLNFLFISFSPCHPLDKSSKNSLRSCCAWTAIIWKFS